MTTAVLVISTGDRAAMLDRFLRSVREHAPTLRIVAVLQEYGSAPDPALTDECMLLPERLGSHTPRMLALDRLGPESFDSWVVADDDMIATERTRWSAAAALVERRSDLGILSCNWRPNATMLAKAPLKEKYVRQAIVFTGGGMVMSADSAAMLLDVLPHEANYVCDNTEWSLALYLRGKINGRYLGSLAIHEVARSGGRRAWLHEHEALRPDRLHVRIDALDSPKGFPWDSNNMLSPNDGHLTAEARHTHKRQRSRHYPLAPEGIA